jgi:prepilin-type N-terminal cleavage/methylation domain-containing protein
MKNKKGFTLIELLVVVLIIGILSAIALPQYRKAVEKSRMSQLLTAASSLKSSLERYYLTYGTYPTYWAQLDIEFANCKEVGSYFMLQCSNFSVDLNTINFVVYDNPNFNISGDVSYKHKIGIYFDHSDRPGQIMCESKIKGLCQSMGYQ